MFIHIYIRIYIYTHTQVCMCTYPQCICGRCPYRSEGKACVTMYVHCRAERERELTSMGFFSPVSRGPSGAESKLRYSRGKELTFLYTFCFWELIRRNERSFRVSFPTIDFSLCPFPLSFRGHEAYTGSDTRNDRDEKRLSTRSCPSVCDGRRHLCICLSIYPSIIA